jgi:hypothetical protein
VSDGLVEIPSDVDGLYGILNRTSERSSFGPPLYRAAGALEKAGD